MTPVEHEEPAERMLQSAIHSAKTLAARSNPCDPEGHRSVVNSLDSVGTVMIGTRDDVRKLRFDILAWKSGMDESFVALDTRITELRFGKTWFRYKDFEIGGRSVAAMVAIVLTGAAAYIGGVAIKAKIEASSKQEISHANTR